MSTARAGMTGTVPTVKVGPDKAKVYDISAEEVKKLLPEYTELQKTYINDCWKNPDYRKVAPGEALVDEFLKVADPSRGVTVIDWGCGTGRPARKIFEDDRELDVTCVDFAYNCLDDDVKALTKKNNRLRFVEHDITKPCELQSEFGFCTDMLEHVPTDDIPKVLSHILWSSKNVFFQISTANDIFSDVMDLDDPLHLTVKDYHWWLQQFADQSVYVNYSRDMPGACIFYVTGWATKALCWEGGYVNTDIEVIKKNIEDNAKLDIQPIKPYGGDGETEVMILCGGPSLNEYEEEIKQKRAEGVKCITVNGTYNWCLERGIKPSLQCMIDARPFMLRMVEQVDGLTDDTKYAISSQCDPEIFSWVPHDRTYMWQVSLSQELVPHITEHFGEIYEDWFPSPGGSTVGLRALLLTRMLGFNKIYIYGMDSCVMESDDDTPYKHHAYDQPENDYLMNKGTMEIFIGQGTKYEKSFQCEPWHVFQAREFQLMVPILAEDIQLQVKGDGMIAYFVEANAMQAEDDAMAERTSQR